MTDVPIDTVQMVNAVERLARQLHEYANEHLAKYGNDKTRNVEIVTFDALRSPLIRDRYRHVARRLLEAK